MDRLHAMQVFTTVAETGSFSRAANALHLSAPAATRAVAALESVVGTRLFTRTTRSVVLTEAGRRYYDDCKRILAELAEAEAAAAGSYSLPQGELSVTAPVLFGEMYVLPVVTAFLDQHPRVTARTVFVDRVTNLVDEGLDVAIRIGELPDSSQSAIRVGEVTRVICAAPSYLEAHGEPLTPEDLIRHRLLVSTGSSMPVEWRFGGTHAVSLKPALTCNTTRATVLAAVDGFGITRRLSYQVAPDVAAGRLRIILPGFQEPPLPVHVIHTEGRRAAAKVRAFVDFAVEQLRRNPAIRG
ncbi:MULTISPECIES: LysR family transcriptional regulator [Asticcacaulis]|uniref:LysR family transcriptional regulator n=1 Tax=Asticcacaulis TaxID=76890 RepID=UPI001AE9B32B|nr:MULTISPECIES: LysR family transcriptional regulator [Asticcacaulis]MBP2158768.1 DNA-binding transcriptional LysR family regulator [Asticcacaulis solisilvae]MDR6799814.1 DNA-binding transcriptional LysR family regulator [Asticcacaulis sp. BE141]